MGKVYGCQLLSRQFFLVSSYLFLTSSVTFKNYSLKTLLDRNNLEINALKPQTYFLYLFSQTALIIIRKVPNGRFKNKKTEIKTVLINQ